MVLLTESGLNNRHREFNQKVIEAVKNNVNVDNIKAEDSESDIHNLFKIELASRSKNIDYIIEVLKSGDSLCITRALKCSWMFEKEYSHVVNPQFINDELFPHLSLKSKKKLLTKISIYVRDEQRAFDFYNFCNSLKYFNIANKFLLFVSEETKITLLRQNSDLINDLSWSNIKHFIGDSFTLAETYLKTINEDQLSKALYELRYLYSNSDVQTKYLDLIEMYEDSSDIIWNQRFPRFGLRLSREIILNHKERIYEKPLLYTEILNKSMFVKLSTIEDAKFYTTALLPDEASSFWDENYYESQKHFFDIIPKEEKYQFIKKIFNEKYPEEPFEMTLDFYRLRYHELMVDLELKEEWALSHIKSEKEILGSGKDYLWYRFVKFDKSFDAIKKYIRINGDAEERSKIISVLIESARNNRDLETLFKYYYERHINEEKRRKETFLDAVNNRHNIFNFDSDCFAALDKIYYSLEIYNVFTEHYFDPDYQIIGLIYRIINNMELPEALITVMNESLSFVTLRSYTKKLSVEKGAVVYDYVMKFYLNEIKSFEDKPYDDTVRNDVKKYILRVLDFMISFDKPKDEIPELVMKYVNLNWKKYRYHTYFKTDDTKYMKQNDLLRCLKRDTSEFVSKLTVVKNIIISKFPFKMNRVLRKLRLYFSNDLAKVYFKLYEDIINEPKLNKNTVNVLVFGIIHLANEKYLEEFMNKHVPTESKIDHVEIDRKLLSIQGAICSLAGYARPPVPLPLMIKYIKGDYTQYCLPLFNMYHANLQPDACIEFVKSILDTPLSIQKQALRLAFKCFLINDLKSLVADMWDRTKNVSLRYIIYKGLHAKILEIHDEDASSLFEILNYFTSTIYDEDEEELFNLLTSNTLPASLQSDNIKTVWKVFENLPLKVKFIKYRTKAVKCIEKNFNLIELKNFIENIVIEHVRYVFDHAQDEERYQLLRDGGAINAKWHLTAKYITFLENTENLEKGLNLTKSITSKCITNWNEEANEVKLFRNLFIEFLDLLKCKSYDHEPSSYKHANILFEYILKELEEKLPIEEFYELRWQLKLNIITRNIVENVIENHNIEDGFEVLKEAGIQFGRDTVALVEEYMGNNMFWIIFEKEIRNAIHIEAANLIVQLNSYCDDVVTEEIILLVCHELIKVNRFETFFLASKMLCRLDDCDNIFTPEYKHVIDKIQKFKDSQMKCFVFHKCIRNINAGSVLI